MLDNRESACSLTKGDAAILRFLAAAEIIESDLWLQYQELGGTQDDEVSKLANNTEFGRSPNLDLEQLAQLGYRMVLYPLTAFRVALRAAQDTLRDIRERGHQRDCIPQMLTRQELYDLLGYADYEARDRSYFG